MLPLPREAFPVTQRWAFLDHAGMAPLPLPALEAVQRCAMEATYEPRLGLRGWSARIEEVRAIAARLMGVPTDDVAFVKNTTEGLGFVASGLHWSPGDRVVVPDLEFPSTLYPWLALEDLGVVVDRVTPIGPGRTLPLEAFAEVIDAGRPPKVVATSWVQYGRGWRSDLGGLARLCHGAGALLCVDVIQGLGVLPAQLEAWGVDFAMADAHKWLLGPLGIGVLYVRGSCLELLRPLEPGWSSVAHRRDWDNLELTWDASARRLEGGSPNMLGVHGMGASLDLLLEAGVDRVWSHVDGLCDAICERLAEVGATVVSDRSPGGRSGIVTFSLDGLDSREVAEGLSRRGVACAPRGGGVRVAPHGYNTVEDVERLVEGIRDLRRQAASGGGRVAGPWPDWQAEPAGT